MTIQPNGMTILKENTPPSKFFAIPQCSWIRRRSHRRFGTPGNFDKRSESWQDWPVKAGALALYIWKSFSPDFCPERLKRTCRQSRTYLHSSNDHPFQKCLLDPFISCFTSLPGHTADTYNNNMHKTMPTCLRMARVTAWHASAWEEIELVLGVKPGDQGK